MYERGRQEEVCRKPIDQIRFMISRMFMQETRQDASIERGCIPMWNNAQRSLEQVGRGLSNKRKRPHVISLLSVFVKVFETGSE